MEIKRNFPIIKLQVVINFSLMVSATSQPLHNRKICLISAILTNKCTQLSHFTQLIFLITLVSMCFRPYGPIIRVPQRPFTIEKCMFKLLICLFPSIRGIRRHMQIGSCTAHWKSASVQLRTGSKLCLHFTKSYLL
jgi:hypothetical protein